MRDAALRFHCRFALGSFDRSAACDRPYRSGRSPDWIKVKNPDAPDRVEADRRLILAVLA
jgi:hypothetical protein